jgi:hypothetical protein
VPTSVLYTVGGTVVRDFTKGNTSGPLTCTIPIPGGTAVVTGSSSRTKQPQHWPGEVSERDARGRTQTVSWARPLTELSVR